jgi:hypothetical protein
MAHVGSSFHLASHKGSRRQCIGRRSAGCLDSQHCGAARHSAQQSRASSVCGRHQWMLRGAPEPQVLFPHLLRRMVAQGSHGAAEVRRAVAEAHFLAVGLVVSETADHNSTECSRAPGHWHPLGEPAPRRLEGAIRPSRSAVLPSRRTHLWCGTGSLDRAEQTACARSGNRSIQGVSGGLPERCSWGTPASTILLSESDLVYRPPSWREAVAGLRPSPDR